MTFLVARVRACLAGGSRPGAVFVADNACAGVGAPAANARRGIRHGTTFFSTADTAQFKRDLMSITRSHATILRPGIALFK